ncbi:MAG TPA: hydrogenase [Verrucomicrobia bacterium]|nr:MAG: hypothetical protein A2X46_13520 [Lentisphaerae bacterium GWF2_57_35]HBA86202.1 hydrogenase [Verrucomicrobiota bacterium]
METHLSILLILAGSVLHGLSGVPGLWMSSRSATGQRIALLLSLCGSLLGLTGAAMGLLGYGANIVTLPWSLFGESITVSVDGLSAFFLVPVFLMGGLGAVYGLGYWPQAANPANGQMLRLFWGLAIMGMSWLLIARHAGFFLFGWEIMALSAFFLVSTESHLPDVRHAGWIYLATTHAGTLALFALFAVFHRITGSFALRPIAFDEAHLGMLTVLFFLALFGFGLKAGMMPLHFWLPAAHASAPSHVSALMSGVLIKMGIYGLIRFIGFLPEPPASWGVIVLASGCISGVFGVALALGQHDIKRLLAYHSVENIGIMLMGFGLALIGRTLGNPLWVALGLAGCLLHVWNHGLFKALLFLSAGAVVHATHTRQLDRWGGLAKRMPYTAFFFLIGAAAICGLPPLNGFVSEWFIYLGLLHTAQQAHNGWTSVALAAPILALIGALALACFVKAYGVMFLGSPRSIELSTVQEAPLSMRTPMLVLAVGCILIGLAPMLIVPALEVALRAWNPAPSIPFPGLLASMAPLSSISLFGLALAAGGLISFFLLSRLLKRRGIERTITWSCGYAAPTARMQYTASSFAHTILGLFRWALRPRIHYPSTKPLFTGSARFETHQDEPILDRQILPIARFVKQSFLEFRPLHQGFTHHYLIYVLVAVIALFIWTMPIHRLIERLFSR